MAELRITGGRWGGRRIKAPRGTTARPTADRVREALFSILGPLDDALVLDLFAGSGVLGLEALSRGARGATWVERDRQVQRVLAGNLDAFDLPGGLRRQDALGFLRASQTAGGQYDLVLLDPPYRLAPALGPELTRLLPAVLAPGARVVSESDRRAPLELDLPLEDERRYGDTLIRIHREA
jgi:16S rRNA (guanine966-N2)-methyltransferase